MCLPFSIIVIILQVCAYLFAQLSVRNDLSYRYIKGNNAYQTFILFVFCSLQKGKRKCPCCLSLDITLKKTFQCEYIIMHSSAVHCFILHYGTLKSLMDFCLCILFALAFKSLKLQNLLLTANLLNCNVH